MLMVVIFAGAIAFGFWLNGREAAADAIRDRRLLCQLERIARSNRDINADTRRIARSIHDDTDLILATLRTLGKRAGLDVRNLPTRAEQRGESRRGSNQERPPSDPKPRRSPDPKPSRRPSPRPLACIIVNGERICVPRPSPSSLTLRLTAGSPSPPPSSCESRENRHTTG
jgi:hypothetical protein